MGFFLTYIITSFAVYLDARNLGIKKGQNQGFFDISPGGWLLGCLFMWILIFPMYLLKRSQLKANAQKPSWLPTHETASRPQHEAQTSGSFADYQAKAEPEFPIGETQSESNNPRFSHPQVPYSPNKPKQSGISIGRILALSLVGFFVYVVYSAVTEADRQTARTAAYTAVNDSQPAAQAPAAAAEKPKSVTASTLVAAYESNEVAGDEKYKGHQLKVTGIVGDIKKDMMNSLYVTLGKGDELELRSVQCFFADSYTGQLTKLHKGQKLTVVGKCDGLLMNVILKDCEL